MIGVETGLVARLPLASAQLILIAIYTLLSILLVIDLIGSAVVPTAIILLLSMLLLIPFSTGLSKSQKNYQRTDDERISFLRDFLMAIKVVKLKAVEESRLEILKEIRGRQVQVLKRIIYALLGILIILQLPQMTIPVASMLIYANNSGGELDPAVVFPSLMYIDNFMMPIQSLPSAIL
ncbi:hypothetical protein BC829DRAFT_210127 [Chytridium lagenaria]|nr:hypothetical protein BC829DRAFT_210127 [Chytridium lagenaria]